MSSGPNGAGLGFGINEEEAGCRLSPGVGTAWGFSWDCPLGLGGA